MNKRTTIVIAEPSFIVRTGLEDVLKHLSGYQFNLIEVQPSDALMDKLNIYKPEVLIINPFFVGGYSPSQLKEESGNKDMKCVALQYQMIDVSILRQYDEQLGIFDSHDEIRYKIERLLKNSSPSESEGEDDQQVLSAREKEIVIGVVKGMTNKEIADSLFLSTHTVITHRRNIARKLQIHSASGLTIYAIVNKLVELSDIK